MVIKAKEKEEIFSESNTSKVHYKVKVSHGQERHALYIQSDGKLVKDKKLKL